MTSPSFAVVALIIGAILIAMALLGTLVERLPLSPGILYLALGYALGPAESGAEAIEAAIRASLSGVSGVYFNVLEPGPTHPQTLDPLARAAIVALAVAVALL